jgi:hypothetical protein
VSEQHTESAAADFLTSLTEYRQEWGFAVNSHPPGYSVRRDRDATFPSQLYQEGKAT